MKMLDCDNSREKCSKFPRFLLLITLIFLSGCSDDIDIFTPSQVEVRLPLDQIERLVGPELESEFEFDWDYSYQVNESGEWVFEENVYFVWVSGFIRNVSVRDYKIVNISFSFQSVTSVKVLDVLEFRPSVLESGQTMVFYQRIRVQSDTNLVMSSVLVRCDILTD